MVLFSLIVAASAVVFGALAVHLVPILEATGLAGATAVFIASLKGAAQVAGRIWDLTLAPASRTERAGLKPGVIPMGARVSISGHRNSDPKRLEVKTERVTWDGRNFDVYAERL